MSAEFCRSLVERFDRLGAAGLGVLLKRLPGSLDREAVTRSLFALRALNIETSQVASKARETTHALNRLLFWRAGCEAVTAGVDDARLSHPVLSELRHCHSLRPFSRTFLLRHVDARTADVRMVRPPETAAELEGYGENAVSSLMYLSLASCGVVSVASDHACSHVGKAYGIAVLLRGTSEHAKTGRVYIPLDAIAKRQGLTEEHFIRGMVTEEMRDAVLEVATVAHEHMAAARDYTAKAHPVARDLLLPYAAATDSYLAALQKANFDPFHPSGLATADHYSTTWAMTKRAFKGEF
jgi:NADH dehydrogenase [ubiquinone] 1 alpha subcomplex assembly factor 6